MVPSNWCRISSINSFSSKSWWTIDKMMKWLVCTGLYFNAGNSIKEVSVSNLFRTWYGIEFLVSTWGFEKVSRINLREDVTKKGDGYSNNDIIDHCVFWFWRNNRFRSWNIFSWLLFTVKVEVHKDQKIESTPVIPWLEATPSAGIHRIWPKTLENSMIFFWSISIRITTINHKNHPWGPIISWRLYWKKNIPSQAKQRTR